MFHFVGRVDVTTSELISASARHTTPQTTAQHTELVPTATLEYIAEDFLPWVIAGMCGTLLLGIIAINVIVCAVMLKKRRKASTKPETTGYSNNNDGQSITYDYIETAGTEYENNAVYGDIPSTDAEFAVENNPSYRTDIQFAIETNPSYKKVSSNSIKLPQYENYPSYGRENADGYVQ